MAGTHFVATSARRLGSSVRIFSTDAPVRPSTAQDTRRCRQAASSEASAAGSSGPSSGEQPTPVASESPNTSRRREASCAAGGRGVGAGGAGVALRSHDAAARPRRISRMCRDAAAVSASTCRRAVEASDAAGARLGGARAREL